jgi:hypothetical protein
MYEIERLQNVFLREALGGADSFILLLHRQCFLRAIILPPHLAEKSRLVAHGNH